VEDGAGSEVGKIAYTADFSAEGGAASQNWKFYDWSATGGDDGAGGYVFAQERDTVVPPGIKWDFEQNKRESYEQIRGTGEDFEKRSYYMEYDSYGREKFVKYSYRDEKNLTKRIVEHSNYTYDETTGRVDTVKSIVKNPDGSPKLNRGVSYDNYDDAGRLTAWSTEDNYTDGRKVKLELSRTYEGVDTVTEYRRKSSDLTTTPPTVRYDFELKDIKRRVNGEYSSYAWENKVTGETGTWSPPADPPIPW